MEEQSPVQKQLEILAKGIDEVFAEVDHLRDKLQWVLGATKPLPVSVDESTSDPLSKGGDTLLEELQRLTAKVTNNCQCVVRLRKRLQL